MQKCKGLAGAMLGHKFTEVYDTDTEKRSSNEIAQIVKAADHYNQTQLFSTQIKPDLNENKRVTRVFRGIFCQRCGHYVDLQELKIS